LNEAQLLKTTRQINQKPKIESLPVNRFRFKAYTFLKLHARFRS
jgi:hypothetical protein